MWFILGPRVDWDKPFGFTRIIRRWAPSLPRERVSKPQSHISSDTITPSRTGRRFKAFLGRQIGGHSDHHTLMTWGPERLVESAYRVKLDVFEGPMDLLYHLVQQEEIDIWDIPIAHITQQYLAYLDALRELDIEVAGEFLVMAARLVYIKGRMLLPDERDPDAEDEEGDPRLDLAAALLEYALFKEAAGRLGERGEGRWAILPRPEVYAPQNVKPAYDDPTGGMGVNELAQAFRKALASMRPPRPIPRPYNKVSVAQKVASLRQLFTRQRRVRFEALIKEQESRPEVVATFLALLELVRRGYLVAMQESVFGPIEIERRAADAASKS